MESELLQSETVTSTYPNPGLMEANAEFLKQRTNVDRVVVNLRSSLGGLEYDRKLKKWLQVRPPVITLDLLYKLEGIVRTYVNDNTIHGNIGENDARAITLSFTEELILLLAFEGPKLNVKSEDMGAIVRGMENLVFMTLTRAINDGERINESNIYKSSETKTGEIRGGKI